MYQAKITRPDGSSFTESWSGLFPSEEERARKAYEALGYTVETFYGPWR